MARTRQALSLAAGLLALAGVHQAAQAACYIVYGADRQVIYRAQTPPVDMSRHLHETLPEVAPGGTMVFTLDSEACELEVHRLPVRAGALQAGGERAVPAAAGVRVRAGRADRG